VPLERAWGWRAIFWVLGCLGVVWSAAWWTWFRTEPEEMPGISAAEIAELPPATERRRAPVPWARLLGCGQLWLIALAYFCYAFGSWFYFGWFTTWLIHGAGFSVAQMGIFASFPFAMGLIGNLIGGVISERLVVRFGRKTAYRWITALCLVVTSGLLLAMSVAHGHAAIVALATLGFGVMDLMLPSAWAMCMSLGGDFGGTATGMMNTAGNLGGWVCTVIFGYVVKATGDYNLPVRGVAAMVLVAAGVFWMVDCSGGVGVMPSENDTQISGIKNG
jgi:MFS transporter, ACS family, glucarate transporter